jgi:AraC family transcriptional regulator, regulatory protein of adaptative response / DNA-3-methyladenine glycosylase II
VFGHLAATAVQGVEEWRDGAFRRVLTLAHGPAIVALRPGATAVAAQLLVRDARDLPAAVATCRRLLDLDADPAAVDGALARDPVLAPLVRAEPGRRVPGAAGAGEMALRAVLGQQVSTAAARTHAGRLAAALGAPVEDPEGALTREFPCPAAIAAAGPDRLALPRARGRAFIGLAQALASGALDLGAGPGAAREALSALPGIGPWTVETVAMRALGDRDAFPATDLGVRAAARRLGLPDDAGGLTRHAEGWRPWRAYAVQHLWATGTHPVNRLPGA